MMTGPLTGTGLTPGGTKVTAVYLSPMTNYSLGRGAASGFWATYLKAGGYDGIIVEGAARKPSYLFINDGNPDSAMPAESGAKDRGRPRICSGTKSESKMRK